MTAALVVAPELTVIRFAVIGNPAPQGSKSLGYARDGSTFMRESSAAVGPWRKAVATFAGHAWKQRTPLIGPVMVNAEFWVPRPGDARKATVFNPHRPDCDKFLRATLDAMCAPVKGTEDKQTAMGYPILSDDGQVVLATISKRAIAKRGDPTGAVIEIVALGELEAAGFDVEVTWNVVRRENRKVFEHSKCSL